LKKKDYKSEATYKIERLQYLGPLSQPNSLKIEIDYHQNVILAPQKLAYQNVWGIDFLIPVMDIKEICAEKIRAMSDRARYRGFYDMFLILKNFKLNLLEILSLVKQKEIHTPISKKNIIQNWNIIGTQKKQEMNQIFYLEKIEDKEIERMINKLDFKEIS